MLLRDTHHILVGEQGGYRAGRGLADGRVRGEDNAVLLAALAESHPREARVQLDLVDGGHDRGCFQQGLDKRDAEIRHAQRPHLACGEELGHLGPGLVVCGMVVGREGLAVYDALGPVHEIEVDVLDVQSLEGSFESLGHAVVVSVVPVR